mmetsp:Transcript_5149/g.8748  ORF Transcript_5149/g.8748 Transcript_5149/m.8748 type:complete len:261 (+) Transcript_5149:677-1459(+)
MDVPGGVLVEGHGLEEDVVVLGLGGDLVDEVDDLVDGVRDLERVGVHLLADLALEALPVEGAHVLVHGVGRLLLLLGQHPALQALEVDQAYRSFALAGQDEGVGRVVLVAPADSALDLVRGVVQVLGALHLHGLTQLLLVQLLLRHVELVTAEVLDSEADAAELDGVELLNLVVILSALVLEGSGDQPQAVHRLLLLVLSPDGVVQVIALLVLLELAETPAVGVLDRVDHVVGLGEVDLVLVSDDLTLRLGLQAHLHNVP